MNPPINQRELRLTGMSRSGNHALLEWLYSQAPGRVCFLNCTEGKNNPFRTARDFEDDCSYRVNYPTSTSHANSKATSPARTG